MSLSYDYSSLSPEERQNVFDRCKEVFNNELDKDCTPFNHDRPKFLCNTITPFWPLPMMFSVTGIDSIGRQARIHVEHEFRDGKWITFENAELIYIPIEQCVDAVKNLIFIPLYIPENTGYPYFGGSR